MVSMIHCQREIVRDTDSCKIIMAVSGCGSNIVISRWCQGGGLLGNTEEDIDNLFKPNVKTFRSHKETSFKTHSKLE